MHQSRRDRNPHAPDEHHSHTPREDCLVRDEKSHDTLVSVARSRSCARDVSSGLAHLYRDLARDVGVFSRFRPQGVPKYSVGQHHR